MKRRIYIWIIPLLTLSLSATSCMDLCHTFGDYHGCQRLAQGEQDCTFPPQRVTPSAVSQSSKTKESDVEHFYTQWRMREGVRLRFAVTVSDTHMAFIGQSVPALDPYTIRFSPTLLESDHMIDVQMQCQQTGASRYECQDRYTQQKAAVVYQHTGKRAFDLKVYKQGILSFHIYSDGRYVHTRYYRDGQHIERLNEDYPIAD